LVSLQAGTTMEWVAVRKRGRMGKGLVLGGLLVSVGLGGAVEGRGMSTKERREGGKERGNALLLLLKLVSNSVETGGGTVSQRGVGVALGDLLVGLRGRRRESVSRTWRD
jgi:hypothetical protein